MSIVITRDAGGISLNAGIREVLRDGTDEMIFDNKELAIGFLKSIGFTEEDIEFFEYVEVTK